ncbi:MAG: histidine phosphatase family protein [Sulfurimonas sp.]|nr:histidine phosphatase family protein [Sulfurimonas sp.]
MKKLYIIRHAKSSWTDMTLNDFERPLNKRGEEGAPFMAKELKSKNIMPDMILSSPALRAKTTAETITGTIGFFKEIVFKENIYEASAETLHEILKSVDDENATLFLVGHNPGLNALAERYVGFHENIPTTGIVEIEFDCSKWSEISPKNAKLISFDYPKRYK